MSAARKLDIRECEVKQPHQWLKHLGGQCPLNSETIVSVRFRNGDVSKHTYAARHLRWHRFPRGETSHDIMAFRIVEGAE